MSAPSLDVLRPALEIRQFEQPRPIEMDEPAALRVGLLELAVEVPELSVEEFVARARNALGERRLAGQQDLGPQEGGAELAEDERVELVGADLPLRAAVVGEGPLQVLAHLRASVAAGDPSGPSGVLNAPEHRPAGAADDQGPQEPGFVLEVPRAEARVVPRHALGRLEDVVGQDGREPMVPRASWDSVETRAWSATFMAGS